MTTHDRSFDKKFFAERDLSKVLQYVEALRKNFDLSGCCVEKVDGTRLASQLDYLDIPRCILNYDSRELSNICKI